MKKVLVMVLCLMAVPFICFGNEVETMKEEPDYVVYQIVGVDITGAPVCVAYFGNKYKLLPSGFVELKDDSTKRTFLIFGTMSIRSYHPRESNPCKRFGD